MEHVTSMKEADQLLWHFSPSANNYQLLLYQGNGKNPHERVDQFSGIRLSGR